MLETDDPQIPGDIWLYPVPNDSTDDILVYYEQIHTLMTNATDSPMIPIQAHMALAEKAASDLALQNGDIPLHNLLFTRYRASMFDAKKSLTKREGGDRYPTMRNEAGY